MNDELIEQVARELLRADHEHANGPTADWDEADPTERIYFLAGAAAAIAAVRAHDAETGPSEAEIQASFHERGTFFRGEVRGILRAAAVERARGEVG